MKIGIVFAGQGAQYEGMGKDLYDHSEKAREIFDAAGDQVKEWCFHSPKEVLRETHVTQPSVYTVTMAAYEVLMESIRTNKEISQEVEIIAYAGFSLGEYAALTAAGSIESIDDCNKIVSMRGQLMHEAGQDQEGNAKGGMVAAFGKREDIIPVIEDAKNGRILQGANFNSPVQTVVAGEKRALEDFTALAKERGVKVRPLSVGTAFHSEMMKSAAEGLLPMLREVSMKAPNAICYSNVTAKDIMDGYQGSKEDPKEVGEYMAKVMSNQIKAPVYWEEIVKDMIDKGVEIIIEIGPGKTLSSICRKISHDPLTLNVENCETLEHTLEELIKHRRERC